MTKKEAYSPMSEERRQELDSPEAREALKSSINAALMQHSERSLRSISLATRAGKQRIWSVLQEMKSEGKVFDSSVPSRWSSKDNMPPSIPFLFADKQKAFNAAEVIIQDCLERGPSTSLMLVAAIESGVVSVDQAMEVERQWEKNKPISEKFSDIVSRFLGT